ncbi:MAG: response regulator transcription factor [Chloroflexi bacterium]|nr:MAG: response regulator transcription factor [Chloroflexota bacterium]
MPPAKKILIVDDEAMIRKAVHLALEKEGYEVVEAETGAEALRRIELSKPDLILLDIMLPDVSGFDVCRDIRKAGLRVPIIILSAKTEEIDVVSPPTCARRARRRKRSTRGAWNSRTW